MRKRRELDERIRDQVVRYWSRRIDTIAYDMGLTLSEKLVKIRTYESIRDRVLGI